MSGRSLRSRILVAAVLWTLGLFIAAVIVSTIILLHYPRYPIVLHATAISHGALLWMLVFVCMALGLTLVRRTLSPLDALRQRLGAVRSGVERRINGGYPSEVQPLVDDLNALLDHQDLAVRRAVSKAGDLAHGLKTPLAILSQEADRAGAQGFSEVGSAIREQVERMQRQVDYHLAHARAAASGATPGATCSVADSVDGLVRTMRRLHEGRSIDISSSVDGSHAVRVQREDLDEMLGNLMDNACKWTRTRVEVSAAAALQWIEIVVDDDGPGVAAGKRDAVLQRGVRADEAAPGSGFGLAIVRELAELYGGTITLDTSPGGGLRAMLRLPSS